MQYQQLVTTLAQLPEPLQHTAQQQLTAMFGQNRPLRLALVGAFSVGKSSLLNSLLNERWLHTAQEEATALPTLIQYAEQTDIQLFNNDDTAQPISREQFTHVTTHAPEQAKCAILGLNQAWLKDVVIVDLPGLGSISEKNHAYTIAQIQQADAILYLLAPRGASASDIDAIQLIQSYAKHLLVLVNRWDEVEKSIAIGEKAPSLEKWSEQIGNATGYHQPLVTTHFQGLNHQIIFDFIANAKNQLQQIRLQRFIAELQPQLENALGYNLEQQQANAELTEQQAQQLHEQLLEKREQLIEIKKNLYQQQTQENTALEQQIEQIISTQKQHLQTQLQNIPIHAEQWQQFIQQGSQIIRLDVASCIKNIQQVMTKFGEINLPEQSIQELNLRLPTLEPIDSNDFLQVAQLNQLKQQLLAKQSEQQVSQQTMPLAVSEAELQQLEQAIHGLVQERQNVLNAPIPTQEQRIYDTRGSETGRKIGEVIDSLLFFLPSTAITKVGKALKLADTTIKTLSDKQQTIRDTKEAVQEYTPTSLLSWLSVATWTEKIGGLFDKPSQIIYTPDPEIQAQLEGQAQQLSQDINQLYAELNRKQDMISENKLAGFALEQKQKEIQRIEEKIVELQQEVIIQQQQAEQEQLRQQRDTLNSYQNRAIHQWLNQFDNQLQGIENYVRQYLKQYWNEVIDKQLAVRLEEIEQVQQQIKAVPEQKAQQLQQLKHDAAQLKTVLDTLA